MVHPTSKQIRIEPVGFHHANRIQELASDPAISATSNLPFPYPPDGAMTFIDSAQKDYGQGRSYSFAVILAHDELIGVCSLSSVNAFLKRAELGYWIGQPYWNRGFATRAASLVVDFAFRDLELELLKAESLVHNQASRRVLLKLGFIPQNVAKRHEKGFLLEYELPRTRWIPYSNREAE